MSLVVVLGSLNIDTTVHVERHPVTGETVMATGRRRGWGGKGGNQAVAAAREGATVAMVGCVGDDAEGQAYVDRLRGLGIDVSGVRCSTGTPTGTAFVALDAGGDNTIVVDPGANMEVGEPELQAIDRMSREDVLLLQLEVPTSVVAEAVARAGRRGARVVLNLAPYASLPAATLDVCDPVVANEHEHRMLAADGLVPPSVLETLGERGARWGEVARASSRVDVVDTTGAGDAFCGVLSARLAAGDDRVDALTRAVAAATASVSAAGAQP